MSIYRKLIETCNDLTAKSIPGWCGEPEEGGTNHWSGTYDVMREKLARPLTDEEVSVLSLSRAYGPLPSVPESVRQQLIDHLWPRGNPRGLRMDWVDLANRLRSLPFPLA